jgi:lysozyme family protein
MTFDQAIQIILAYERGYVSNPQDPGGATNFGISQRSYPQLNISTITRDQAIDLYKRDFWDKEQTDKLPDSLKLVFFDSCVNQGAPFSVISIQRIVGSPIDGIIGESTLNKIQGFDVDELFYSFCKYRLERYIQDKDYATFGVGWIRRLFDIILKSKTT